MNGGCAIQVLADGAPCADDDPCTVGDTCKSGQCTGGGNLCGCLDDDDCLPLDDGDLCNGVPTCVKEGGKGLCKADPSSAVQCGPSPVPCTSHVCQPSTGQCLPQPAPEHDGKPCDDGDACTTGTGCAGGSCTLGQLIACDDGKPCTKDACSATSGCVYAPLDATVSCDDGNACTSADTCDGKGTCIGQPVAACNDNEACTMDACDAAKGCVFAPIDNGAPCNDGDACTIGDACSGGSCKGGQSKVCDDQMPCTLDGCDASTGCTVKPVQSGTPCDDGVVCTEGDACDAEGGCFGTLKNCEDGKPCTLDACKDGTCTHSDIADGGKCDDGNPCVDSACSGTFGCVVTPKANGSSCGGDGAVCDGGSCGACDLGAAIFFEGGFLSSVVVVEGGVTATGVSSNRGWWLGLQDNLDKAWSSVNNAATLSKFIAEHSDAVAHEGGVVQVGNQFLLSNQTTTGVVYGVDAKGTLTFSTALPTNTAAWDISSRGDKSFVVFGYDKNQAVSVTVWFDTAGKIKETSTYGSIGTVEFQSGAFVTGQDYIAGGFQKNKVGTPFWVGRVNHKQGTASWQTAPSGTANGSAADIAVLGSVVYAAGATYSDLGAQYGSLYALGANDGKVAWQALDGSPVAAAIWNGVAADDKGVVVAGSRLVKGGGLAARLVRYDTSGKRVGQHSPKYGTYAQLFDVQLLPDGGGVAVGSGAAGSGSEVGYAVRFGPTGALYCTGAP